MSFVSNLKIKNNNKGNDVIKWIIKQSGFFSDKIFFKNKKDRIYFDLPNFIKSQLKSNKISKIDVINTDTFVKKNNFFSARQSIKLKHDDYGRNISIIMIN